MPRTRPFDRQRRRHRLRFGEDEGCVADADLAQLHDALERLHVGRDPAVRRLQAALREALAEGGREEHALELDVGAARKVQLAVYAEQVAGRPVSPALAGARLAAFRCVEAARPSSSDRG